jgi:hypothetical protein
MANMRVDGETRGSDFWQRFGPADAPVAVVLPGSASTAQFVATAFAEPLAAAGYALVTADPPRGPDVVARQFAALDHAVRRWRPVLVGGVELGAHLVARWSAGASASRWVARGATGPWAEGSSRTPAFAAGLLLVMPAWTGSPETVAAASGVSADEVEAVGVAAVIARLRGLPEAGPDSTSAWVTDELATAWSDYGDEELAATLRATASAAAPTTDELGGIDLPCGVVALTDDALHPVAVAEEWTKALPRAALCSTTLAAVGADRETLGRAAVLAWLRSR